MLHSLSHPTPSGKYIFLNCKLIVHILLSLSSLRKIKHFSAFLSHFVKVKLSLQKLLVSCNPSLTSFYSKNPYPKVFSPLPTPNQRKTCIKHTFLPKRIIKKMFFSNHCRKQTISFSISLSHQQHEG